MTRLKQSFDDFGFVHISGFLSTSEVQDVVSNLSRYKAEVAPQLDSDRVLYDIVDGGKQLKQMINMQDADPFFFNWLRSDRVEQLAGELLGEDVVPHNLEYFEKAPGTGTPTPPHQDGYYFCLKPNIALTIWVAIDDCDEENGCLSYVSGSHKLGIIDHEGSNVNGFSQGLSRTGSQLDEVAAMPVKAGDCLIHHSATIHSAGPNRSDRWRRSFGLVFYAESAKRDPIAWERYEASIKRQREGRVVTR